MAKKRMISDELYLALSDELDVQMDELDLVSEVRSRISSLFKDFEKVLKARIRALRLKRAGKMGAQPELPGTEKGGPRRDPAIQVILDAAEGVPSKLPKAAAPEKPTGKGVDLERLVGSREEAAAAHFARAAGWKPHPALPGAKVLAAPQGDYVMKPIGGTSLDFILRWEPRQGRAKGLGQGPESMCHGIVNTHMRELIANEILGKDAGPKDLEGEAVKRRKTK